jgi:hypothetical protein
MHAAKGKKEDSVEMKLFKVLKEIGVESSSHHGGSLNGKDIKKVMNNAAHIFNELTVIMKEGKRPDSILADADVDVLCLHFFGGVYSVGRCIVISVNCESNVKMIQRLTCVMYLRQCTATMLSVAPSPPRCT